MYSSNPVPYEAFCDYEKEKTKEEKREEKRRKGKERKKLAVLILSSNDYIV